jgi:hypothetical protein
LPPPKNDDHDTGRRAARGRAHPRSWREEFDGLKPYKPIAYKKPVPTKPLALKEARRLGVKTSLNS